MTSLQAADRFGGQLVAELAAEKPGQNIFVSPTSVAIALGMAELGAQGESREAIEKLIGLSPGKLAELSRALNGRKGVELSIASAVWADLRVKLSPVFVSQARRLNFQDAAAADIINDWVKQQTRGKIDGIVNPRQVAASQLILTNAVYFKGKWKVPFDKALTAPGSFHLASGGDKQVPFMHALSLSGAYRSGAGFEAAILPYNGDMELWVLLPDRGTRPETVLAKSPVLDAGHGIDLELKLPKFTMSFDASLKQALAKLGMGPAFHPKDDFFIGDVLHRTRLEIDEVGTVAAAVTAILAPTGIAPRPPDKKRLIVDRPFALILYDRRTASTVFAGIVYDPA